MKFSGCPHPISPNRCSKRGTAFRHKQPWTYRPWLTKKTLTRHRVADPLPVIVPRAPADCHLHLVLDTLISGTTFSTSQAWGSLSPVRKHKSSYNWARMDWENTDRIRLLWGRLRDRHDS